MTQVLSGQLLYALTFALELLAGVLRSLVAALAALIVLAVLGLPTEPWANLIALLAGFGPLAFSAAAFLGVPGGGGYLLRAKHGAREPSTRERTAIEEALDQLSGPVAAPRELLVVDGPTLSAFVIGRALYLERALIADAALPAVLAHELGHLNSPDGQLTLALNRLAIPARLPLMLSGLGGLSLVLLRRPWAAYWRRREFAADTYAARLGQADLLVEFLESALVVGVLAAGHEGHVFPHGAIGALRLHA